MYLIVTVDTEADNQWAREEKITLQNIAFLPRFQTLCDRYGFPPTYFVTYEAATDPKSIAILKGFVSAGAEIGAHLHPWTTPPYEKEIAYERKVHRFPHELSDRELKEKLETLTNAILSGFGKRPASYRAGRWGLDDRSVRFLEALGYEADCSITPKISWAVHRGDPEKSGGPDYRRAQVKPYCLSPDDILKPADKGIVEIPLSVLFTGFYKKEAGFLGDWFLHLPDSIVKKILNRIIFRLMPFRVFPNSRPEDFASFYASAKKNNLPVIEFMIHSSELMPGGSPYAKTESAVEETYRRLERVFQYLKNQEILGTTAKTYAAEFGEKRT